ncbi:hypothetical protein SLEP1_g21034 [Rubroshorea leprosula]|uniref:Calcium uniporter protein n=1 Tax=Rubroshorea leprosula TaxID=152421 RepID=A0AAV5JGL4_9ROSI|nr:hypothetical protein SLEP1_g21034 [Rubroshorea leprosula]
MWRRFWMCSAVKQGVSAAIGRKPLPFHQDGFLLVGLKSVGSYFSRIALLSSSASSSNVVATGVSDCKEGISLEEAKKLMRLVNVEELKRKLGMVGKEVIGYSELLEACQSIGVARSMEEAILFARVLDEAGVVLLFRDKVYLHPDKVMLLFTISFIPKFLPLSIPIQNTVSVYLQKSCGCSASFFFFSLYLFSFRLG